MCKERQVGKRGGKGKNRAKAESTASEVDGCMHGEGTVIREDDIRSKNDGGKEREDFNHLQKANHEDIGLFIATTEKD